MTVRSPLRKAVLAMALACGMTCACNAVTGTDKYELVDCPSGSCADASDDAATLADVDATDTAPADTFVPLPDCGSERGAVRLTVTGSGGTVMSNPGGLSVAAGNTADACFGLDALELRTDGAIATWSGVSCKDGNHTDRCELSVSRSGLTVIAALP